jgi:hypothetical protein
MRVPPMMSVELDGQIVRRPGVLDVLQYDAAGTPVISRIRPQLLAGEMLQERIARIPAIIRTKP